jgi:hypothetical protein
LLSLEIQKRGFASEGAFPTIFLLVASRSAEIEHGRKKQILRRTRSHERL